MKTPDMSDGNTIRNKTRTPNIVQNAERPLPSPVAAMKLNDSDAPNTSPNANKTMVSQKLHTLKQRRLELEKQLAEKNTLLQSLCREEAKLIGSSSYSLNELGNVSGIDCGDGGATHAANNKSSTLTRRHIDTGFKLPENLLNSTEDINQLLLSKQIQQQISQASLRFANDATQTKSIRRTHKQSYDSAQQKIHGINQSLRMMRNVTGIDAAATPDELGVNNNLAFATLNSVNNNNKTQNTNIQLKASLNVSTSSLERSAFQPPERRNSVVSTSSMQYLAANATKARQRCDSYSGPNNGNACPPANANQLNGNDKMPHSPSYYPQQQFPHLQYKSHADKIAYVTNAVANAAPANITSAMHSPNGNAPLASPKYGRLRNPLTVDTTVHDPYAYPALGSAGNQPQRIPLQPYHGQHVHRHSPYSIQRTHSVPNKLKVAPAHAQLTPKMYSDEEDDIAGQYATLLTLSDKPTRPPSEPDGQDNDTHYTEILYRQPSIERRRLQASDVEVPPRSQGLGGCWTTNENNERVWLTMDSRYASLDRKSQKNRVQRQVLQTAEPPTKSTSLGNFNFIPQPDDTYDPHDHNKRSSREKQWVETSLDAPPSRRLEQLSPVSPISPVPTPYYRDSKTRLSSHSMHSAGRNPLSASNASNVYSTIQPPHMLANSPKTLSTSATILATTEANVPPTKQPLSPPYYHNAGQQLPAFDTNQNAPIKFATTPDAAALTSPTAEHPPNYAPNASTSEIHVESPKNMTVVQQAKFQPYKEVSKPFEMSDFYKYSTKYRQQTASISLIQCESNSPQLPPKNAMHHMKSHRPMHAMPLNAMAEPAVTAYSINQ